MCACVSGWCIKETDRHAETGIPVVERERERERERESTWEGVVVLVRDKCRKIKSFNLQSQCLTKIL